MYNHIKIGNLVKLDYLYNQKTGDFVYLVIDKEYEHRYSSECTFYLLNEEGKLLRYYASANNPYKNIKNLF